MKRLLIFFTILTLTNLNAQEKQNDATWEETVEFLRKNIHNLNDTKGSFKRMYAIENDKIIVNRFLGNNKSKYILKLDDVKEVFTNKNNLLCIKSNGKYVEDYVNGNLKRYFNFIVLGEEINDEEYLKVITAFKHLAYLANKKRPKSKF